MATALETSAVSSASTPKAMFWGGWVLSGLSIAGLLMSATMKLMQNPKLVEDFVNKEGYPASTIVPIGITELLCVILYAVPRTSVLGAALLTGYLGGAVATHVRTESAFIAPIVLGVFVWGGLFLRDARIRALLPIRR